MKKKQLIAKQEKSLNKFISLAHEKGVKLIQISTDHMYDNLNFDKSSNEITKPKINNYYTKNKIALENIALKKKCINFKNKFFFSFFKKSLC